MKKILLLIFIIILSYKNARAQTPYHTFPEDSAQWSIWLHGLDSITMQSYISSYQLKMYGDTLINGVNYNKVYKSTDINYPALSDSLHCFIRQDTSQKKIFIKYPYYMYSDSSDILLYDFNLQVGDIFNFKLVTDGTWYSARVVSIVDSVQTNVDYRRVFNLSLIGQVWGAACDGNCFGWFEGIGNTCNFLFPEIPQLFCDAPYYHSYNTECFWEKGVYITGGTFCDFNTGINNGLGSNDNTIEIIPNPVVHNSKIMFHKQNKIIDKIIILNYLGQTILESTEGRNSNFNLLELANFKSGLYLLMAEVNGIIYSNKFVVL